MFYRWLSMEFDQPLDGVETEENLRAIRITGTLRKGDFEGSTSSVTLAPGDIFVAPKVEIVPIVRMW